MVHGGPFIHQRLLMAYRPLPSHMALSALAATLFRYTLQFYGRQRGHLKWDLGCIISRALSQV